MHTLVPTDAHRFGRAGDPQQVTRTIVIDMGDSMRYKLSQIQRRQGETIRFIVRNKGADLHEIVWQFTIGKITVIKG